MGERLKQLRIDRGLRLKDVADAMGLTLRAICNYEAGTREPSIAILIKLCDFYDVTADYLIGRTDY